MSFSQKNLYNEPPTTAKLQIRLKCMPNPHWQVSGVQNRHFWLSLFVASLESLKSSLADGIGQLKV